MRATLPVDPTITAPLGSLPPLPSSVSLESRCLSTKGSSAVSGGMARTAQRIKEPCKRSRQRADDEHEAEAHRKQECALGRDAVIGKQRYHRELAQTPAADRDGNERNADHHGEQDGRVRDRQDEALRMPERPDGDDGEGVNETSKAQDHRALRSEQDATGVHGQCRDPTGISPAFKERSDDGDDEETEHASEQQQAVEDEQQLAVSA